jgi:short-subunit dehydrogenase
MKRKGKQAMTWVVVGATSAIAQAFAHTAAEAGHPLLLIARDKDELEIIAEDLALRHHVPCDYYVLDLAEDISVFLTSLKHKSVDMALFIAASSQFTNDELTDGHIQTCIQVNVLNLSRLIWAYMQKPQKTHRLLYLSSVAGERGRAKNSLYGGSKAAIDVFLQGLQQSAKPEQVITIARLGFIDTVHTYGQPGIFYASTPVSTAKACWKASSKGKRIMYHPSFWRFLMTIIRNLPFFIFRRVK